MYESFKCFLCKGINFKDLNQIKKLVVKLGKKNNNSFSNKKLANNLII